MVKYWSDDEIQKGIKYWRRYPNDGEKMARIFYIHAMKNNHVYKYTREKLLPNLKKCLKCEYGTIVYDEKFNPKKIECCKGFTLLDMVKDYCII